MLAHDAHVSPSIPPACAVSDHEHPRTLIKRRLAEVGLGIDRLAATLAAESRQASERQQEATAQQIDAVNTLTERVKAVESALQLGRRPSTRRIASSRERPVDSEKPRHASEGGAPAAAHGARLAKDPAKDTEKAVNTPCLETVPEQPPAMATPTPVAAPANAVGPLDEPQQHVRDVSGSRPPIAPESRAQRYARSAMDRSRKRSPPPVEDR